MEYWYSHAANSFVLADMETGELIGTVDCEQQAASVAVLNYGQDDRTDGALLMSSIGGN